MLRLITAQQWIRETFPEGGVGIRTVEKWIIQDVIHGKVIGGKPFVDADRTALLLESNTVITFKQDEEAANEDDPVAKIIAAARAA